MTKVRIVYSNSLSDTAFPHDNVGTNGFEQNVSGLYSGDNDNQTSITFTLRNTPIADSFVAVWDQNKMGPEGVDSTFTINYNEFSNIDLETRYIMQQQMNDVIDRINQLTNKYIIPADLRLTISPEPQVEKLNALHRYFEDTSYELMEVNGLREDPLHLLLENINQLVHRMEGPNSKHKLFMTVIRNMQKINIKHIYNLQDHDYELFESHDRTGVLFLDFATVGKDLGACFHTNDMALVHAKEVKQQLYCMPYFNYRFSEYLENNTDQDWKEYYEFEMNKYYEWCEENNVGEYYDYKMPKYRLGRIPIGDIDNNFKTADYLELIKTKPYIVGVYIEK